MFLELIIHLQRRLLQVVDKIHLSVHLLSEQLGKITVTLTECVCGVHLCLTASYPHMVLSLLSTSQVLLQRTRILIEFVGTYVCTYKYILIDL